MATTEMWGFRDETVATVDLDGFEVQARDGAIGKVVQTAAGHDGGYLIVEPGAAMPLGHQVLVPAGFVESVELEEKKLSVGLDRKQVRSSPEFDPARPLDEQTRMSFAGYYGAGARTEPRPRPSPETGQARTRPTPRQPGTPTKAELYEQAKRLGIEGRSKMSKNELARAVSAKDGGSAEPEPAAGKARANPVEVQAFLEGVNYPTGTRQLLDEAKSQGARPEVRATLEQLSERQYGSPTEVSEAIGRLD